MMQHFNYSLYDLDNMIPWERDIYIILLNDHIQEQNERMANQ